MENAPTLAPARPPAADPLSPPAFDRRRVRRWGWMASGVLLLAYLLLQNPYWVPGGDSDFYVSIARSLARGQGYKYNSLPVAISPPGWPWVMALVMKVSPYFLTLKLTAMLSMYGSLVMGYFIALRFVRPSAAAVATVLAGLLMPVYSLTYFLHSEGLYCLFSALALLLALRLREGRGGPTHVAVLLLTCAALPLVRWAGVFQLIPIAAVLVSGRRGLPWARTHWKTAVACVLVIVGTWVTTRKTLELTDQEAIDVRFNGTGSADPDVDIPPDAANVAIGGPIDAKKGVVGEYTDRVLRAGKWFTWTLWQPSRFVSVIKPLDVFVVLAGWGVIVLLGYLAVVEARRGEYLWLSLALYTGGLCLNWDNPNSRYFVPVAPLIIVGLLLSTRRLGAAFPLRTFDAWKWLRRGLVYSILACNLAMYGVDVIVMRSGEFYKTFEAGQHKDLIAIARYLTALPPAAVAPRPATLPNGRRAAATTQAVDPYAQSRPEDGDVMLNERYENLGRARFSKAGSRAMVLLTDRFLKTVEYTGRLNRQYAPPFSPGMGRKMRDRGTEWLVTQAPARPWRVWHFHLPTDLYKKLAKDDAPTPSGGWMLYHFTRYDRSFAEQRVPPVENWPTRVPGL